MKILINRIFYLLLLPFFFLLVTVNTYAQDVVLNEICPSNYSGIVNSNGNTDDWIEIYNRGTSAVSLNGWGLTDDITNPHKFTFPNTSLDVGRRLVIFASSKNNTSVTDHWSCAVGNTGWKYYSQIAAPPSTWNTPSFSATGWTSCTVPLGYNTNTYTLSTNLGGSTPLAVAMRNVFTISDTSKINGGALFVDYDDGYVIRINGVEVSRANFSTFATWQDTNMASRNANYKLGLDPDSIYLSKSLLKSILIQGTNVLTMEIHSRSTNDMYAVCNLHLGLIDVAQPFTDQTSNQNFLQPPVDFYSANFKLSRTGETVYLTDTAGIVVDNFTYTYLESDNSQGRCGDGNNNWRLYATPTPGGANPSGACYLGYAPAPVLDSLPGFYPGTIRVACINRTLASYKYTINGDLPDSADRSYPSTYVRMDTSTTLRVRGYKTGYLPSKVVTNTYIIGSNLRLPVVTMTTDSAYLWDSLTGIYVLGPWGNYSTTYPYKGANFWQEWPRPAHIEYYDKQRTRLFDFDADISIYGNYTRAKPQKSFEIDLSSHYGLSTINYPLIPDKPCMDNYQQILIRNAGNDWNKVHFRDVFMQRSMKYTNIGYCAGEPVVGYLNGTFWGVYWNEEKHDNTFVKDNFGLSNSEMNILEETGSTVATLRGSDTLFWKIFNYTRTHSPTSSTYYDWLDQNINLKNYTDYFITETYVNNDDWIGYWTNNIRMWSSNKPDAKLNYMLIDLDMGFGFGGLSVNTDRLSLLRNPVPPSYSYTSDIFDTILYNPTYRRYFINRYADLMNTTYFSDTLDKIVYSIRDSMANDMLTQFRKWGSSDSTWRANIEEMRTWYKRRPAIVRNQIVSQFNLVKPVTWTMDVSPPNAGRILISTVIPPSYPWSGIYFDGNPVTITAIPNPGFTFNHWASTTLGNPNLNQTVTVNYTASQLTTAFFTGSAINPQLYFSEINYNSDSALDCGDWVELHNPSSVAIDLSDWEVRDSLDCHRYTFPIGTVIPAGGYLVLATDMAKFTAMHPTVTNVIGPIDFNLSNGGDQIRLLDYRDVVQDSVYYRDVAPWSPLPDGQGFTLERATPPGNPYDAANWFPGCYGGSPGRAFNASLGGILHVNGGSSFCQGSNVSLSVPSLSGALYQWYYNNNPISGATDSTLLATQYGRYFVLVTYAGCSSRSDTLNVTRVTQNTAPVVTAAYRCGEGLLSISATASDSLFWYTTSSGGTPIDTGNVFDTPYLIQSDTFYVQSGIQCASVRVPAIAQILVHAADPVVADTTILCGPGQVTVVAQDTAATRWYNAPVGGALIGSDSAFTIQLLPNDTVVYAESGTLCPSNRVPAVIEVATSSVPNVNSSSRCGTGMLVLLASSSDPLAWYDTLYGGTPLSTSPMFVTPMISATTTFYVQTNGLCPSARVPVLATIYALPPVPTLMDTVICFPSSVQLTANSPEQVNWYSAISGGTPLYTGTQFTTPVLSANTVYYAQSVSQTCSSARVPVRVSLFVEPHGYLGPDTLVAAGAPLTLTADTSARSYSWSNGATTASTSVTAGTDTTGIYTVVCTYAGGCTSSDTIQVDFSTAVVNPTASVSIQGVYPNPANDHARLILTSQGRSQAQIQLVDMTGRAVVTYERVLLSGQNRVDLFFSELANGSYMVRVLSGNQPPVLHKLVINR